MVSAMIKNSAINEINAQIIGESAISSMGSLMPKQQELLFQTKKEQTFSSLLAHDLQSHFTSDELRVLVELKGVDYKVKVPSKNSVTNNRNTHDIGILDVHADLKLLIENKVWYHFDGAKGSRVVRVEKSVTEQLHGDIFKLRHTASNLGIQKSFILINIVTPSRPENLPKSYKQPHEIVLKRTSGDLERYRKEGLNGIMSVLDSRVTDFKSMIHLASVNPMGIDGCGFHDVICAEIKI
jgi:hypothetical protein